MPTSVAGRHRVHEVDVPRPWDVDNEGGSPDGTSDRTEEVSGWGVLQSFMDQHEQAIFGVLLRRGHHRPFNTAAHGAAAQRERSQNRRSMGNFDCIARRFVHQEHADGTVVPEAVGCRHDLEYVAWTAQTRQEPSLSKPRCAESELGWS